MIILLFFVGILLDDTGNIAGRATGGDSGCGDSGSSDSFICTETRPCGVGKTCLGGACVAEKDTEKRTYVQGFDREFINSTSPHVATFDFPNDHKDYESVVLYMTITCPGDPSNCDPRERTGELKVVHEGGEHFEIARFITPYDITRSGPESCEWAIDITPYQSLLRGPVTLRLFIQTSAVGERGWVISTRFGFLKGNPTTVPYRVINLWNHASLLYGDPGNPIDNHLQPKHVPLDDNTTGARVRAIVTGHGLGNTDNAAEFTRRWHRITAGRVEHQWTPWRDDCRHNTCSPQDGNWTPDRAGWCPGDSVLPMDIDLRTTITPGGIIIVDYDIQPYENCCRPGNSSCDPQNRDCCMSFAGKCKWNNDRHTSANWRIASQLVLYRNAR